MAQRCCLCLRPAPLLLDLPYGPTCAACLRDSLQDEAPDAAAALLCVAILEEDGPDDFIQGGSL